MVEMSWKFGGPASLTQQHTRTKRGGSDVFGMVNKVAPLLWIPWFCDVREFRKGIPDSDWDVRQEGEVHGKKSFLSVSFIIAFFVNVIFRIDMVLLYELVFCNWLNIRPIMWTNGRAWGSAFTGHQVKPELKAGLVAIISSLPIDTGRVDEVRVLKWPALFLQWVWYRAYYWAGRANADIHLVFRYNFCLRRTFGRRCWNARVCPMSFHDSSDWILLNFVLFGSFNTWAIWMSEITRGKIRNLENKSSMAKSTMSQTDSEVNL